MAEALGVTASVIAVPTLVWESSKKLYELVDKLRDVPKAITHTKFNLFTTQSAIETLKVDLATGDSALPSPGFRSWRRHCLNFRF